MRGEHWSFHATAIANEADIPPCNAKSEHRGFTSFDNKKEDRRISPVDVSSHLGSLALSWSSSRCRTTTALDMLDHCSNTRVWLQTSLVFLQTRWSAVVWADILIKLFKPCHNVRCVQWAVNISLRWGVELLLKLSASGITARASWMILLLKLDLFVLSELIVCRFKIKLGYNVLLNLCSLLSHNIKSNDLKYMANNVFL